MSFKSQKKIFEYLSKGGKITNVEWIGSNLFLFIDSNGKLMASNGYPCYPQFTYPGNWLPYAEGL